MEDSEIDPKMLGNIFRWHIEALFPECNFQAFDQGNPIYSKNFDGKIDMNLWHYTSIEGMIGLFNKNSIWASSIYHMNDQAEVHESFANFAMISQTFCENTNNDKLDRFFRSFYDKRRSSFSLRDRWYFAFNAYVACFSEEENLLSQWRAYGGGRDNLSLGFSGDFLRDVARYHTNIEIAEEDTRSKLGMFSFIKVIYDQEEKISIMVRFLEQLAIFIEDNKLDFDDENTFSQMEFYISVIRINFGVMFKNIHFREEKEWRLVCICQRIDDQSYDIHGKKIEFRHGRYGLTPYINIELKTDYYNKVALPIKGIYDGPSSSPEISIITLKHFLVHNEIFNIQPRRCGIPLR